MAIDTRELLDRQRKRLVGAVLGHCENARWWQQLSELERRQLRDKVLTAAGAYHDLMLDLVRSTDDGAFNEHALQILDRIHAAVKR